jgi:hypothetical protein
MLSYMEHPVVREAMGLPNQAAQQATKRQQRQALLQAKA